MTRATLALLFVVACKESPEQKPATASSVAASTASSVSSAASTSQPAKEWYEGTWQGTYKAELLRLETAAGGVKQWKDDDGSKASGDGKLLLEVAKDGSVSGTATGALGEQGVSGKVEGQRVALSLTPAQSDGFRGVILASHAAGAIQGTLNASTGDSLQARRATVTLSRAAK
jgi:hypothetical protein